jgi:hypothetical protein
VTILHTVTIIALIMLGLCAPVALWRCLRASRGTTLIAPLVWAAVATGSVVAVQIATRSAGDTSPDADKWKFLAYAATFCPAIAMLGAKRPQDRAWQMIVLAMWFVVAWPAIQSLVVRPGEVLELHVVWKWFCAVLALVWIGIQAASRFFPIALCISSAQLLLFWRYLPFVPQVDPSTADALGITFLSLAALQGAVYPWLGVYWKRNDQAASGWNRVWLDFRDYFGLIWWHPVMERANVLAKTNGVPIRLDWHGFCPEPSASGSGQAEDAVLIEDQITPSSADFARLDSGLRNLLRRFVSNRWIDERL